MKLHLPKQLFTALLTAITLAASPVAKGKDAFTNIDFTGDFYAKTYEFSFMLNEGATSGTVVGAYWGGNSNNGYGANALAITNVVANADGTYTYTLELGRGGLNNTNIDSSTTFAPKTSAEDAITFTGTFQSGVVYTISGLDNGTTGDSHASASITQVASGSVVGATGGEYYKNNMNGSGSTNNGVNSAYSVAGGDLVWCGSGDAADLAASSETDSVATLSNWKTAGLSGTASTLEGSNLIFDATSTVAKKVNITDSVTVGSISVYDDYTFIGTGEDAASLTVSNGLTIAAGGTLTLSNATMTLNGAVTLAASSLSFQYQNNGYSYSAIINALTGTYVAGDNLTINGVGVSALTNTNGSVSYTGSGTVYHVVNGTVKLGENEAPVTAGGNHTGYEVHKDAVLDINGKQANNQSIWLNAGATLTNSGADIANTTGDNKGVNKQQISHVYLKGDASVTNTGQMGIISANWANATLDLAGHTLTKTGAGMFSVANAAISAGTIDIQRGEVLLSHWQHGSASLRVDDAVVVKLAEGTTLSITGTHTSRLDADFLLNSTGTGTISIHRDVAVGSSSKVSAFAGTISVVNGELRLGNGADSGTNAMQQIDLSAASLDMDGGTFRYFGGNSTIGTLNVNSTPDSFSIYATNTSNATGTLTFNKINVANQQSLVMTPTWSVNVSVGELTGAGSIQLSTGSSADASNCIYTIESVASGFGSISNAGTLNLGAAGKTVHLGSAIENTGSITLNGTLVLENLNREHFDIVGSTFYSSTANATETLSGYVGANKYQIINGTVTKGDDFSYSGTYEFDTQKGLLVTVANTDTTHFYVNENIRWGVAGTENDNFTQTVYTNRTASIYVVGEGKTLDLNFSDSGSHGWEGKRFELHEGAILANGGAEGNTSWQQLYRIDLLGDAKIDASGNDYGFLASGYNESILNLNGYTLEKTGTAAFRMVTTSINDGTIKITGGAVQIGAYQAAEKDVTARGVDFVLNRGNLTFYDNGNALTAQSISGNGNINSLTSKKGELTLVGNSGTYTITGNVGLNKLNLNGSNSYTLAGSMEIGTQLSVTSGKLELTTGASTLAAASLSGGTLQVTSGNVTQSGTFSQTGGTLQINGGTVTFDGRLNGTSGIANLMGGDIFFNYATNTEAGAVNVVNNLDVAGDSESTAQVYLAQDVKLQVNGNMRLGGTAAIKLAEDAELKKGNMAIIGTGNDSTVTRLTSGNDNTFSHGSDDHVVTNAHVNMSSGSAAALALKLDNTAVTNTGAGELTVSNSGNSITNLAAKGGNVAVSESMGIDSISAANGKVVSVAAGKTVTMGGGTTISTTDSSAAASLTAKSDAALVQMQQDASFSIQDMTLTNTSISADNAGTKVSLNNVSVAAGSAATLAKGAFAMQNQAIVGMGGSKLEFTTSSYSGFTLGADASLTVDLGDLSCLTPMEYGQRYDLTITLSGFSMDDYMGDYAGSALQFAADSWLGELLAQGNNANVHISISQMEEGAAAAGGGGGATGVSYSTGNVGTIITITGLNVPEPATSTLSLLALAGLCARRRRKM